MVARVAAPLVNENVCTKEEVATRADNRRNNQIKQMHKQPVQRLESLDVGA